MSSSPELINPMIALAVDVRMLLIEDVLTGGCRKILSGRLNISQSPSS